MKKLLWIGLCLLLCGAAAQVSAQDRALRKQETAQAVAGRLEARDFLIDITLVQPVGLATFTPSLGQYYLAVRGEQVSLYLPYVGRGYNVPFGGGPSLRFTAPLEHYQVQSGKKGASNITLAATSPDNREVFMTLTVYPTASAYLRVRVDGLQMIGYSGTLDLKPASAE